MMKRIVLLFVLALEGIGGILGGVLLAAAPDGHFMNMPVAIMHGVFPDFLLPGLILTGMGILTLTAFVAVWRKRQAAWLMAGVALIGFTIWFAVEIVILRELHWLHIMWGTPILVGIWAALPLIPKDKIRGAKLGIGLLGIAIMLSSIFVWQGKPFDNQEKPSQTLTPSVSLSPVTSSPTQSNEQKANITIASPEAMERVSLPIIMKGKARVFENQFNYRVRDVNKNIILEGSAYAKSPNTGLYGDYTIQISSLPTMRANAITLEVFDYSAKDGQEIDTVSVPVVFDPVNTTLIKVFFSSKQAPAGKECTTVFPVEHHIAKTQATARAALEELLQGPMTIEKNNGYYTNINDDVTIQKLTIENGVAKVDFDKKLEEGIGGSCKVTAIRTQITQTLKQFPTVKDVVISIDGRTEDMLQP